MVYAKSWLVWLRSHSRHCPFFSNGSRGGGGFVKCSSQIFFCCREQGAWPVHCFTLLPYQAVGNRSSDSEVKKTERETGMMTPETNICLRITWDWWSQGGGIPGGRVQHGQTTGVRGQATQGNSQWVERQGYIAHPGICAVRIQKAVIAYFPSKQLLSLDFLFSLAF